MLVEFTVGNYRSFKEKKTFSMVASRISVQNKNFFEMNGLKLLRTAAIYGDNSSGKTNLVRAMRSFEHILRKPPETSVDKIETEPFLLNPRTQSEPSHFEMVFIFEAITYRYGFEVSTDKVHREWLFGDLNTLVFTREGDRIELGKSKKFPTKKFVSFVEMTNENTLFLQVLDRVKMRSANMIMMYFNVCFEAALNSNHLFYRNMAISAIHRKVHGSLVPAFFNSLGHGIEEIVIATDDDEEETPNRESRPKRGNPNKLWPRINISTVHPIYDDEGKKVDEALFDLDNHESTGTRKMFEILGPIAQVLAVGGFYVMDELDANLHPLLTTKLIQLFNSTESNPKNAQLVLTSHDTHLLKSAGFKRDQIWFTQRDSEGATDLYSLADFKDVKKEMEFESNYLKGKFGAIPIFSQLNLEHEHESSQEE